MPRNFKGGDAATFLNEGPRDLKSYLTLFEDSNNEYNIDISPDYFYYYRKSIKNIKNTYTKLNIAEPKIIIILRNPIERVFSMYHHTIRLNGDYLNFDDAFAASKKRIKNNYSYNFDLKGVGMSFKPCNAYLENFKEVKILLFDDFKKGTLRGEIFDFMGIEKNDNKKNLIIRNKNSYSKIRFLKFKWFLSKLKKLFISKKIIANNKESFLYKILLNIYLFLISNRGKTKSYLKRYQINRLEDFYKKDIMQLSNL